MACHGLTSDMVFEILIRASPETVRRCRLVSREWNRITYEPRFMALHSAKTGIIEGFILAHDFGVCQCSFAPLNGQGPDLSLSFLGLMAMSVMILASHGGILVCVNRETNRRPIFRWLVCKPSTKEWIRIPNPKTKYGSRLCAMVVIRSKPKVHYKILRVSIPNWRAIVYEVFDSEAGKWKRLWINNSLDKHDFDYISDVVVGGTAFWLEKNHHTIFSFDMYEETREKFPVTIPIPVRTRDFKVQHYSRPRLMNIDGKLGFLVPTYCGEFMDLWVMENRPTRVWEKIKRISFHETGSKFPLALSGTDVALVQGGLHEVVLCRFQSSTTQAFRTKYMCISRVFPYCSDSEVGTLRCFRKAKHICGSRAPPYWWDVRKRECDVFRPLE